MLWRSVVKISMMMMGVAWNMSYVRARVHVYAGGARKSYETFAHVRWDGAGAMAGAWSDDDCGDGDGDGGGGAYRASCVTLCMCMCTLMCVCHGRRRCMRSCAFACVSVQFPRACLCMHVAARVFACACVWSIAQLVHHAT